MSLSILYPYRVYANDAAAISAVLATLIANGEPPRVEVTRVHSAWLDRPPYPGGRLLVRGSTRSGPGGAPPSGFVVFYCCARFGRAIPVREVSDGGATISEYDAPAAMFSCLANSPWAPNDLYDGWRETYNAALDALT